MHSKWTWHFRMYHPKKGVIAKRSSRLTAQHRPALASTHLQAPRIPCRHHPQALRNEENTLVSWVWTRRSRLKDRVAQLGSAGRDRHRQHQVAEEGIRVQLRLLKSLWIVGSNHQRISSTKKVSKLVVKHSWPTQELRGNVCNGYSRPTTAQIRRAQIVSPIQIV